MRKPFVVQPNNVVIHATRIILLCGVMCVALACHQKRRFHTDAVSDRTAMPVLDVDSVSTLISDSGVTRYRISAQKWQIFDKASPSYWLFPQGIYLEKFDEQLHVDASLQADYAKYLDESEVWELTGHVHALNEEGETFDTPQLFWNQKTERVWSDSAITITRASSTLMGIGFESNQTMTRYTILHPTGFFPVEE